MLIFTVIAEDELYQWTNKAINWKPVPLYKENFNKVEETTREEDTGAQEENRNWYVANKL